MSLDTVCTSAKRAVDHIFAKTQCGATTRTARISATWNKYAIAQNNVQHILPIHDVSKANLKTDPTLVTALIRLIYKELANGCPAKLLLLHQAKSFSKLYKLSHCLLHVVHPA
jgi:hypothetical protein